MNRNAGLALVLAGFVLTGFSAYALSVSASSSSTTTVVTCGPASNPCTTNTSTTLSSSTTYLLITTTNGITSTTSTVITSGGTVKFYNPSGSGSLSLQSSYPTTSLHVVLYFINITSGVQSVAANLPFTLTANPGYAGTYTLISPSVLTPSTVSGKTDINGQYAFDAQVADGVLSTCMWTSATQEICGVPTPVGPWWDGSVTRCSKSYCSFIIIPNGSPAYVNVGSCQTNACAGFSSVTIPGINFSFNPIYTLGGGIALIVGGGIAVAKSEDEGEES